MESKREREFQLREYVYKKIQEKRDWIRKSKSASSNNMSAFIFLLASVKYIIHIFIHRSRTRSWFFFSKQHSGLSKDGFV